VLPAGRVHFAQSLEQAVAGAQAVLLVTRWDELRSLRRDRGLMKVVLFCGGLGTRMREHAETIPKSLVVGPRPIIWHLMRWYASYGHKEFVLCLGYRGDLIKQYFLNYDECRSNAGELSPITPRAIQGGSRATYLALGRRPSN
jgi:hypothetical protein